MIYKFLFILLCFNFTYSQNIVTVYFDTDKYALNTTELNKLMFFNDNKSEKTKKSVMSKKTAKQVLPFIILAWHYW